jgi:hypothetical protein
MTAFNPTETAMRRDAGNPPRRADLAPVTLLVALALIGGLASLAAGAGNWLAAGAGSWRVGALVLVAAGLGLAFSRASFGFTHGYRQLIRERRTAQVRGQMLLLALVVLLFQPALAAGGLWGQPVRGFVFPVGIELIVGAFLFGLGMQIAGACGSGTLYALGGGSARMALALLGLVAGATLAAFTAAHWSGLPRFAALSLPGHFGLVPALALQLGLIGGLWLILAAIEKRRHGDVASIWRATDADPGPVPASGHWPLAWGAIAIAVLAFAALLLLGRPWGIVQAFALWGSWAAEALALDDPHFWAFWEEPTRVELLSRPLLTDATSVMNLGVILGAVLAAGLAGGFALRWRMSPAGALTALAGGALMGFGGILATGCNISALVSGVASGSLHGWVWLAAALPGTWLGVWLRPRLGLQG